MLGWARQWQHIQAAELECRFTGVYFVPAQTVNPWVSQISAFGKLWILGSRPTEHEAALAYDAAAFCLPVSLHGIQRV